MNLQETIAELERQAAQYSQAADALRQLMQGSASTTKRGRKPGKTSGKKAGRKRRKRGPVSDATRAKIAAALKRSHAARKASAK